MTISEAINVAIDDRKSRKENFYHYVFSQNLLKFQDSMLLKQFYGKQYVEVLKYIIYILAHLARNTLAKQSIQGCCVIENTFPT